MHTGYNT